MSFEPFPIVFFTFVKSVFLLICGFFKSIIKRVVLRPRMKRGLCIHACFFNSGWRA
jgi:hypothetical protein